jgi:hypothetical protein
MTLARSNPRKTHSTDHTHLCFILWEHGSGAFIHTTDKHHTIRMVCGMSVLGCNRITSRVSWTILLPHKRHFYFSKAILIFSFRLRNKTILGLSVDYVLTETLSRQTLEHGLLTFLWKSATHVIVRWCAGRK